MSDKNIHEKAALRDAARDAKYQLESAKNKLRSAQEHLASAERWHHDAKLRWENLKQYLSGTE